MKTICLATAGLLLPSIAFAAGLGRLSVLSALGEPLRAEIEIVSVQPDESDSLAARLAPQEAFRQANIDLNSALYDVRFVLERRPNGQHVIVMSSNKPMNEPFIDMLLELNWAGGRLIREYTFLLDPPEYRSGPAVATPTVPVTPPSVKPLPAEPPRVAQPAVPAPAPPAVPAAPSKPAPAAAAPPARPAAGAATYEVRRGDTLSRIAGSQRPEGVSLQQMLVALYRANQDAFIGNNMNRLRAGRILSIPDAEAARALSEAEARKVVATQSAEYAEYQRSVGVAVATAPERQEAGRQAAGKITEPAAAKPAPAPAPSRDTLRLAKPDEKGAGKAAAAGDDATAKEKSLREAQERIAMLEKNIADLKKLQDLKSAPGAQLQQQAEAAKAAKGEPAKKSEPAKAEPAKPEPAKAAPKAGPAAKAEPGKAPAEAPKAATPPTAADAGKAPVADASKAGVADASKAAPAAAPDAAKPAEAPKPPPPPAAKAPAKPAPPPPPPPTLLEELFENVYALIGLGVVVLLLIGYAAFAWRKKKRASEQQFASSVMSALPVEPSVMTAGGRDVDTSSSVLTDLGDVAPKVDAEEIDPVAEADVYMAYGRDAQAEEILKEALAKDPQRLTVHLKLLEVYANRKDARAFEAAARAMQDVTGGQGPEWDKAVALGASIDPGNPLYGGGAGADSTVILGAAVAGAAAGAAAEHAAAPAVDFDLDAGAAPDAAPDAAPAAAPEQAPTTLDFDLDLGSDKPAEPASEATAEAASAAEGGMSIDFDLGMGGDAKPAEAAPAPEEKPAEPVSAPADGGGLAFDLKLDDEPAAPEMPAEAKPAAGGGTDFDLSAISLDLGSDPTVPAPPVDAKWQEVATKLDLAKAYEEMGDKDGARDLLNEVMKEGDNAQQQQAKSMLEAMA